MAKKWTAIIEPPKKLMSLNLKEVWQYRDLILLFVKRDFTTRYKQTILGPFWFIIQPLLITVAQTFIFGNVAGLSTDGVPKFLFYMAGNVPWLYFSDCITKNSNTFTANSKIFGKIYFPRLTTPISAAISSLINFFIQFAMFVIFTIIFMMTGSNIHITWVAALTPLFVLELAILGIGFGIIISSLTTKFWMYLSPVIIAGSSLPGWVYNLMMLNPVSPAIELMRYGWLGSGTTPFLFWGISWVVAIVVLFIGIIMFNKVEKTFMDTV